MAVILFAILGASTRPGTAYWICFGIYFVFYVVNAIRKAANESLW